MPEGIVKWFDQKKGYGFILMPDGKEIFVHYSAILGEGYRSLNPEDPVLFEITEGPKGLQATNVQKL